MSDGRDARIFASAWMSNSAGPTPPRPDYSARHHIGQRLPYHAIPAIACYLLLVVAITGIAAWAINTFWWAREELVSTHGLLPNHRLNQLVTATAVETGTDGNEQLLVADKRNFFVATPVKQLRYWQWFRLDELGYPLANSTIRGLSASDGKLAIVPEESGRRGLELGTLPGIGSRPALWDRPTIDTSSFPGASDEIARSVLFDPASGQRLIGGLGVAPYDPVLRHWGRQVLSFTTLKAPQINELTALGDGLIAALGTQGVDTLRWADGTWQSVSHLDRIGAGGLGGVVPEVAHFTPAADHPQPGSGELTYLTAGLGLGRLRLTAGRIDGNDVRIGEGRADKLSRDSLMRAQSGTQGDSAWMLYRIGEKNDAVGVALYRYAQHQMLGLPADKPIPVGADAIIAPDPQENRTAWIGGRGLYAVRLTPDNELEAIDTQVPAARVEQVAPGRNTVFAAARNGAELTSPLEVLSAPRDDALGGLSDAWSAFIGPRQLDSPLSLADITAATDGTLGASHDSALIVGTRKDGIVAFDRASRELYRPFNSAVVSPGTEDLHARGKSIVQVGDDHSVNFFDGTQWKRLIAANGTDLAADGIRVALSLGSDLVLSDGKSIARYSAQTHQWQALPRLEVSRMVLALDSLWAVGPKDALYRLPLADPKSWQPMDNAERVIDLYADAEMIAVIGRRDTTVRAWVMTAGAKQPTVVFQSNDLAGDPSAWREFAVRGRQLFVVPQGGAIGHYDGDTHTWSSIDLPPGSGAPRGLAATDSGLWFVDDRGKASFRPLSGNAWTVAAERVQRLRTDGHKVAIVTEDGHVAISNDGAAPLRTIVGDALSAAPERVSTGIFFKNMLILASDAGVHRYDPRQHQWENAALPAGPIVEFAHAAEALYARTRAGGVLLWKGKSIAEWVPVNDAGGSPLHADRLAGSDGSYVAAAAHDGGVSAMFAVEPTRARPVLLVSRLHAAGTVSAAAEIGQELIVGTSSGAIASYAKSGDGPRSWSNDLTNPQQTGPVHALLVPPGRSDRLIVAGTTVSVLQRQPPDGRWMAGNPVLRNMAVAQTTADARSLYGLDTRVGADSPLARVDLASGQEVPIIAAAFPNSKGSPSSNSRDRHRAAAARGDLARRRGRSGGGLQPAAARLGQERRHH